MSEDVDTQRCATACIPAGSPFSLDAAVAHFSGLQRGRTRLTAEKVRGGRKRASGLRVGYGRWQVAIWLGRDGLTAADHAAMLQAEPLPAPAGVITSCRQSLTVWGDPDPGGRHGKQWAHCLGQLQTTFGLLVWDFDRQKWWAE